ncbi:unnamed protein product [Ectocarpus sp. 8 AP-2014]
MGRGVATERGVRTLSLSRVFPDLFVTTRQPGYMREELILPSGSRGEKRPGRGGGSLSLRAHRRHTTVPTTRRGRFIVSSSTCLTRVVVRTFDLVGGGLPRTAVSRVVVGCLMSFFSWRGRQRSGVHLLPLGWAGVDIARARERERERHRSTGPRQAPGQGCGTKASRVRPLEDKDGRTGRRQKAFVAFWSCFLFFGMFSCLSRLCISQSCPFSRLSVAAAAAAVAAAGHCLGLFDIIVSFSVVLMEIGAGGWVDGWIRLLHVLLGGVALLVAATRDRLYGDVCVRRYELTTCSVH